MGCYISHFIIMLTPNYCTRESKLYLLIMAPTYTDTNFWLAWSWDPFPVVYTTQYLKNVSLLLMGSEELD